jgi:hypothetical protein
MKIASFKAGSVASYGIVADSGVKDEVAASATRAA